MKKIFLLILILLFPINAFALSNTADAVILMDEDNGRILYAKNIHEKHLIASTTKIMTAILAIDSNKLNDTVKVTDKILEAYGSNIYLSIGEEIKLIDLLYGLMLRSGNDAALTIAEYVGGSVDNFVSEMNKKAQSLGMKNTTFCNPHGLDEKCENISTAYDMALLTRYANKNETYKKIVGTKRYTCKSSLKSYDWYNKNKLLSTYKYTTGGKTGFTEKARRTLVTTASKDNVNLIVVTLNDPNDFTTHKDLYEYGFNNYEKYMIIKKQGFNLKNDYYKNVYIKNDISYLFKKDETNNLMVKYVIYKKDNVSDNDIVGKIEVYINSKIIKTEDIYVRVTKEKISIFRRILNLFK